MDDTESNGTETGDDASETVRETLEERGHAPVMTVHHDGRAHLPETRDGADDRIVIPTGGSDVANRATDHAMGLAERYGAEFRVVYVVNTSTCALVDAPRSIVGVLKQGGHRAVESIPTEARDRNLSATATLLRGVPVDAILRDADGASADLIAVGTRDESADHDHFIGSTTTRLVGRSTVPVLTLN